MGPEAQGERDELAAQVIAALSAAGLSVSVAESLTGGLVTAALTSIPGSSACVRGGIVSYATDLKGALLGVDERVLSENGPVDERVASQMASGVAQVCGSDFGVATTGVAGPSEQGGVAVGTVYVAVWSRANSASVVSKLHLEGSRDEIRTQTVRAALELVLTQSVG